MNGAFELASVSLAALLSENFILVNCMALGTHVPSFRSPKEALRTGWCLTFVMVVTSLITWMLNRFLLVPMRLEYFRPFLLSLLIPTLVWLIQQFLRLFVPELSRRIHGNLGSISTNCAALGCALLVALRSYSLPAALTFSFFGGLGATLALASFASLLLVVDTKHCPRCFRGYPIRFITAGLMGMALIGFYGLHIG